MVGLKGLGLHQGNLLLGLEYASQGSLVDVFQYGASEAACMHVCYSVFQTLDALHRANIIHGDVKPANIFVMGDEDNNVVLGDYNVSICFPPHLPMDECICPPEQACGTKDYAALELRTGKTFGRTVDIFALGKTILKIAANRGGWTSEGKGVVNRMVSVNPAKRLTIERLIMSGWKEAVEKKLAEEEEEGEEEGEEEAEDTVEHSRAFFLLRYLPPPPRCQFKRLCRRPLLGSPP